MTETVSSSSSPPIIHTQIVYCGWKWQFKTKAGANKKKYRNRFGVVLLAAGVSICWTLIFQSNPKSYRTQFLLPRISFTLLQTELFSNVLLNSAPGKRRKRIDSSVYHAHNRCRRADVVKPRLAGDGDHSITPFLSFIPELHSYLPVTVTSTLLVLCGLKVHSHEILYSIFPLTPINLNSSIHNWAQRLFYLHGPHFVWRCGRQKNLIVIGLPLLFHCKFPQLPSFHYLIFSCFFVLSSHISMSTSRTGTYPPPFFLQYLWTPLYNSTLGSM